jgi:hypothetical protein
MQETTVANQHGLDVACMATPWLLSIGFVTAFSALFSKTWRLNKVCIDVLTGQIFPMFSTNFTHPIAPALSKWTGFPSGPGESQGCHLTIPRALFSEYNDSNSMDCCSTNDMDAKVDGQR